jgi:hypothetical protein
MTRRLQQIAALEAGNGIVLPTPFLLYDETSSQWDGAPDLTAWNNAGSGGATYDLDTITNGANTAQGLVNGNITTIVGGAGARAESTPKSIAITPIASLDLWWACKFDNGSNFQYLMADANSGTGNESIQLGIGTGPRPRAAVAGVGFDLAVGALPTTWLTWHLSFVAGTKATVFEVISVDSDSKINSQDMTTWDFASFFQFWSGTSPFLGEVGEIRVFKDLVLDTDQQTAIKAEFNTKWGCPIA